MSKIIYGIFGLGLTLTGCRAQSVDEIVGEDALPTLPLNSWLGTEGTTESPTVNFEFEGTPASVQVYFSTGNSDDPLALDAVYTVTPTSDGKYSQSLPFTHAQFATKVEITENLGDGSVQTYSSEFMEGERPEREETLPLEVLVDDYADSGIYVLHPYTVNVSPGVYDTTFILGHVHNGEFHALSEIPREGEFLKSVRMNQRRIMTFNGDDETIYELGITGAEGTVYSTPGIHHDFAIDNNGILYFLGFNGCREIIDNFDNPQNILQHGLFKIDPASKDLTPELVLDLSAKVGIPWDTMSDADLGELLSNTQYSNAADACGKGASPLDPLYLQGLMHGEGHLFVTGTGGYFDTLIVAKIESAGGTTTGTGASGELESWVLMNEAILGITPDYEVPGIVNAPHAALAAVIDSTLTGFVFNRNVILEEDPKTGDEIALADPTTIEKVTLDFDGGLVEVVDSFEAHNGATNFLFGGLSITGDRLLVSYATEGQGEVFDLDGNTLSSHAPTDFAEFEYGFLPEEVLPQGAIIDPEREGFFQRLHPTGPEETTGTTGTGTTY